MRVALPVNLFVYTRVPYNLYLIGTVSRKRRVLALENGCPILVREVSSS